jgi:hypothetical protein
MEQREQKTKARNEKEALIRQKNQEIKEGQEQIEQEQSEIQALSEEMIASQIMEEMLKVLGMNKLPKDYYPVFWNNPQYNHLIQSLKKELYDNPVLREEFSKSDKIRLLMEEWFRGIRIKPIEIDGQSYDPVDLLEQNLRNFVMMYKESISPEMHNKIYAGDLISLLVELREKGKGGMDVEMEAIKIPPSDPEEEKKLLEELIRRGEELSEQNSGVIICHSSLFLGIKPPRFGEPRADSLAGEFGGRGALLLEISDRYPRNRDTELVLDTLFHTKPLRPHKHPLEQYVVVFEK